jgi:serine/threonine-protein kinase
VLYEMLTGQPPHVGGSAQQIIMRIVTDTARPVTELRKTVAPNVAAAVARALEKLPADRFATAKDFAEALGNPGFTSARMTAGATLAPAGRAWILDPRTIGVMLAALGSLIALGWMITRPTLESGPREYDVAPPDSAPADMKFKANFVVAPRGDFVIYERGGESEPELWYRSLFDGAVRRIGATERAYHPTISPDGGRFAFLRLGSVESTVEVMSVEGGASTVIAQSRAPNSIEWLADGHILLTEGDGFRARLLDPGGGPATDTRIQYCINPSRLPDGETLLCGGGGDKYASWVSLADSAAEGVFRTSGPDSSVFGADFRVFDDKYLVWVSNDGDLLAAPVDLAARRIGRSVRMVTGLGRDPYSGAGSYVVSATGTLVFANGINGAVGHLVRANAQTSDTLPVGRDAFSSSL